MSLSSFLACVNLFFYVLGRVDELFRNLTVAQDSILVGDEVPS